MPVDLTKPLYTQRMMRCDYCGRGQRVEPENVAAVNDYETLLNIADAARDQLALLRLAGLPTSDRLADALARLDVER